MGNNSIFVIEPFRKHGLWVFNDESRGLVEEPFVFGMPQIIDKVVNDDKCFKVRFIFSDKELPEYDLILNRMDDRPAIIGTWYHSLKLNMSGWLCPAHNLYFEKSPEQIYIKIEKL